LEKVYSIFNLSTEKNFTEDEAYELVNLLVAVTGKAKNKINNLNSKLEYYKLQADKADSIQFELNTEIQKWSEKVKRLGGTPLSLYKVKIPGKESHFIWEFPSVELEQIF
tara:strand:- start:85 stop:414 length:330 start_codon:yes stop_codon:yes gene_type:complete